MGSCRAPGGEHSVGRFVAARHHPIEVALMDALRHFSLHRLSRKIVAQGHALLWVEITWAWKRLSACVCVAHAFHPIDVLIKSLKASMDLLRISLRLALSHWRRHSVGDCTATSWRVSLTYEGALLMA